MTIIDVSSTLHNDEIDEFPVEKNELEMLSDYLAKKDMSIFEFFRSIDLDDSGLIDGYELQQAYAMLTLQIFHRGTCKLMEFIDIDGDGRVNLPGLTSLLPVSARRYRRRVKRGGRTVRIGLVGKPNVGKSTFFAASTLIPVDIANYPFCTIEPNVGFSFIPSRQPCHAEHCESVSKKTAGPN